MKTIKKSVIIVISSIFAAVSFTACTADDEIVEQTPTFTNNNREYPVSDVKVMASGIVRVESKRNFTRGNVGELKPEDFNITQVSESEAKMMLQNGDVLVLTATRQKHVGNLRTRDVPRMEDTPRGVAALASKVQFLCMIGRYL